MINMSGRPLCDLTMAPSEGACGVYVIWNFSSNKAYIGSSKDIDRRMFCHRCLLRKGNHYNRHLQAAYAKYGESSFAFNVLEVCSPELRIKREAYWIKEYQSAKEEFGYNATDNPTATKTGSPTPDEIKKKISHSLKKRWEMNPEIMENRSLKMRGIAPPIERSLAGAKKRAVAYRLISPSGDLVEGKNIAQFCRERGLPETLIGQLARGKYPPGVYKGWKNAIPT